MITNYYNLSLVNVYFLILFITVKYFNVKPDNKDDVELVMLFLVVAEVFIIIVCIPGVFLARHYNISLMKYFDFPGGLLVYTLICFALFTDVSATIVMSMTIILHTNSTALWLQKCRHEW